MTADQIAKANAELRDKSPLEIVRWAIAQANGRALVSTNFRPYEAVILHLCVQVQPDIPVLWVDHGYNRPATYKHAEALKKLLKLNLKTYLPKISAAHHDAIYGEIPSTDDEAGLKQFSALMKLEPFQRGMKELAPTVWITALRQGAESESRRTRHCFRGQKFWRAQGQPGFLLDRRRHGKLPEAAPPAQRMGLFRSGEGRRQTRMRFARDLGFAGAGFWHLKQRL